MGNLKTGSTAIQAYLYEFREQLLNEHNILVPESLAETYTVYSGEPYYIHKNFKEINLADIAAFKKEIAEHPNKDIILSNEWYNGFSHKELPFFKEALPNYTIKVILYVRRIDSFLKSFYNEQRKRRVIPDLIFYESYVEKGIKYFTENTLERIKTSVEALGKENVILRLYDRKRLKNEDIICDFFDILSIDIPSNPQKNKSINASVEVDSFAYLCSAQSVLSKEGPMVYAEEYNRIFHLFLNAQKSIPNLSDKLESEAIAEIEEAIEELEKYAPGYKELYADKPIDITPPHSSVTPNEAFLASVLCSVSVEVEKLKKQNTQILQKLDLLLKQKTQEEEK